MNEQELTRKLKSVGKTVFVEYFSIFQSYSNGQISKENCIDLFVSNEVSNENGSAIRCGNAKLIFEARMECEALRIISESNRLSDEIISNAQELIKGHCK